MPPLTLTPRSSKETAQRIWSGKDDRHDQPVIWSTYVVPANFLIRLLWWMWAVSNLHSIRAAVGRAGARTKDTQQWKRGRNTHTHTQGAYKGHTPTLRGNKQKKKWLAFVQISVNEFVRLRLKIWFCLINDDNGLLVHFQCINLWVLDRIRHFRTSAQTLSPFSFVIWMSQSFQSQDQNQVWIWEETHCFIDTKMSQWNSSQVKIAILSLKR